MTVVLRRLVRLASGGTRRGLMLGRSVGTPTALRCSVSRPVAELAPLASPRYAQTGGDKSVYERAARGAASPALLAVPEIAPAGYRPPRVQPFSLFAANTKAGAAKVRSGRSEGASEAARSTGLVACARSAHQQLTCRRLFERSAAKQAERVRRRAMRLMQCARTKNSPCGLFFAWHTPWRMQAPRHGRQSERQRRPPQRSLPACPDAPLPAQTQTGSAKP